MEAKTNLQIAELVKQRWQKRRRYLLGIGIKAMAFVALIFIPINWFRGAKELCYLEIFILCVLIPLYLLVKNNRYIWLSSTIFTIIIALWGILTLSLPETDISAYIWISLGPAFSFFMFGKRFSAPFSLFLLALSICSYALPRASSGVEIPPDSALGYIGFVCLSIILSFYHEHVREKEELELFNVIRRKHLSQHKKDLVIDEFENALTTVNTLRGLLPVCKICKKIEQNDDSWLDLEEYIQHNTSTEFTHGLCPDCAKKLYPDLNFDFNK